MRDCSRFGIDRKSTRLNSSHGYISYAVFCLKKKQAFGLAGVTSHTWSGSRGSIAYWNAYVSVTQIHCNGNFVDPPLANETVAANRGLVAKHTRRCRGRV